MDSGYSKTPLFKKLGIKEGFHILLKNAPAAFIQYLTKQDLGTIVTRKKPEGLDYVHLFCENENALHKSYEHCKGALKKDGMLWISWPKKNSNLY